MKLTVVGIGPGHPKWVTLAGKKAIDEATLVIGAKRHLLMFEPWRVHTESVNGRINEIVDVIDRFNQDDIVILASGDPLLYGIGKGVRDYFPDVKIISGISSLQYIFTRIEEDMNDLYLTSTHGRTLDFEALRKHNKIAMVTDRIHHPGVIAQAFVGESVKFYVGTNLGYEDECIESGPAEHFTNFEPRGLHVVVITYER